MSNAPGGDEQRKIEMFARCPGEAGRWAECHLSRKCAIITGSEGAG